MLSAGQMDQQKEGDDVAIVDVRRVPLDFHARFQAKERTYVGNWTQCRAENLNDLLVIILTCLWGFFPSNLTI
jgi:hypothetical protein